MKKLYLRLLISTGLGALFGVFCIIGVSQRSGWGPLPNDAVYLTGAWYNRLIMGIMIGLAGEIHFFSEKNYIWESIIRGVVIGTLISISFAFLQQYVTWTYFFAGIAYGLIIDPVSTFLVKKIRKTE